MSDRDYYEILGLTPRADGTMVDQAYWHLVRKYQTLAATNSRAQSMIDEVNEAYGVLGNPNLREQYDAFRDDVLIRRGMLQPVASKPKRVKADAVTTAAKPRRAMPMPGVTLPQNWRTYSVSVIIALLAFAAAWQGVNVVLVTTALAAGLGFSLTPALTRRMSEMTFEMPHVAMPTVKAPRIDLPSIQDLREKDEAIDADALTASTREIIGRWRKSVGLKAIQNPDAGQASSTLAEIVHTESQIAGGEADPFAAVMDILRSGAKAAPERAP